MGSLNPQWLSIELDSIDATIENWSPALWTSYEASLLTLAANDIAHSYLVENNSHLEEIAASLNF